MLLCSTGAWAADLQASFGTDFSSSKWTTVTDGEEYYMVVGDIKLTLKKGTAVTALTQGMTTGHLRVYKGASITFTSFKGDISEVAFTTVSDSYPATNFTVDGTNLTGSSWTGEEEEVTFDDYEKPNWDEFPIPKVARPRDRRILDQLNKRFSVSDVINSLKQEK